MTRWLFTSLSATKLFLEAQMLMLASHNILNPANGAPITVPSQDMVLGLYYITKLRPGAKGDGYTFYGVEEATIAYNEVRSTSTLLSRSTSTTQGWRTHPSYGRYLYGSSARQRVRT